MPVFSATPDPSASTHVVSLATSPGDKQRRAMVPKSFSNTPRRPILVLLITAETQVYFIPVHRVRIQAHIINVGRAEDPTLVRSEA